MMLRTAIDEAMGKMAPWSRLTRDATERATQDSVEWDTQDDARRLAGVDVMRPTRHPLRGATMDTILATGDR